MKKPTISILLPVRNEEKFIGPCLDQIFRQEGLGDNFEVIVADGMSTDRTREIIRAYQVEHPNLILIDNPGKIVPTGMNAALRLAHGEIIVRVDGHCMIALDYVSRCVEHLQKDGVDGVGGPMETIGETPLSETIAVAMSSPFGVGNSYFRIEKGCTKLVDTMPFPAYTRAIIDRVGLYDEEMVRNQDDEYNYRIREEGGQVLLAADVASKYFSRGNLGKLWKQYFQYGFYKVRVLQKHPRQMSFRQFVPPVFVAALVLSALLALLVPWGGWLLAIVAVCYLAANLVASVISARQCGWQHLLLLPVTFAILHLSYGSGFLVGLAHFWNRWGDKKGRAPALKPAP